MGIGERPSVCIVQTIQRMAQKPDEGVGADVVKTSESEPRPNGHAKDDSGSVGVEKVKACLLSDPYVVSLFKLVNVDRSGLAIIL